MQLFPNTFQAFSIDELDKGLTYRAVKLLFRPLLRVKELYTQMGFFCSVNFGRSIYSS